MTRPRSGLGCALRLKPDLPEGQHLAYDVVAVMLEGRVCELLAKLRLALLERSLDAVGYQIMLPMQE